MTPRQTQRLLDILSRRVQLLSKVIDVNLSRFRDIEYMGRYYEAQETYRIVLAIVNEKKRRAVTKAVKHEA